VEIVAQNSTGGFYTMDNGVKHDIRVTRDGYYTDQGQVLNGGMSAQDLKYFMQLTGGNYAYLINLNMSPGIKATWHEAKQGGWDVNHDGVLWQIEVNRWYRIGNGKDITVAASTVDLRSINPNVVKGMKAGTHFPMKLLFKNFSGDGTVFGELEFIYQRGSKVSIVPNMYDFEVGSDVGHPWFESVGGFIRNIFTEGGKGVATGFGMAPGNGTPYMINFSGTATLGNWQNKGN
jgi:hypothetical protein